MTERSQQERAKQEDLMARGPVSRGASNQSAPMNQENQDTEDQQAQGEHTTDSTGRDPKHPDYNKMLQDNPTETPVGGAGPSKRDLGTVGGGTIPNTGTSPTSMGDREAPHGKRAKGANEDTIDEMTSRAPDKLPQKETSEKADQKKKHNA